MTLAVGASQTVYLAVWEQEIPYTTAIKRNGNQSGGQAIADNGIFDYDVNIETSRRVQRQIQLVTSNADGTKKYLPVATISSGSAMTDTRAKSLVSLANLTFQSSDVITALGFTPVTNARTITAGNGLTGGGDLTANRTLTVNFAGTGAATTVSRSDHNHDTTYTPLTRSIATGNGLTGGGDLSANRTLAVNFAGSGAANTVARSDHNHDSTYAGLSGDNTLTGVQTITAGGGALQLKAGATTDHVYISLFADSAAQTTRSGYIGYGSVGSSTIRVANEMSNGGVELAANGTGVISFLGNTSVTGTLATTGAITEAGTSLVSKYAAIGRQVIAGSGLTGGGTLAADRTLTVNFAGTGVATTVSRSDHNHDTAYATATHNHDTVYTPLTRTVATGNGLTGGGDLSANRTLSVSFAGTGAANTVSRSDHNHDTTYAKISGQAFTGAVSVPTSTAYTTPLVRNISFGTADPTGGSNGDVYFKYV
jgi:hypothetical protein